MRGYAYQVLVTALAWLDIDENSRIYLEVVEDYAVIVNGALNAVQVKDTKGSGSVTLNSKSVRNAIISFVDLMNNNPDVSVHLRFFTTSNIGKEKVVADRPAGEPGLEYWKKAAARRADLGPLRAILESDIFGQAVQRFSKNRDDETLHRELIQRIHWDCGKHDFQTIRRVLEDRLVVIGLEQFQIPPQDARRLVDTLVHRVIEKSIVDNLHDRVLTRADLYRVIGEETLISVPHSHYIELTQLNQKYTTALSIPFQEFTATHSTPSLLPTQKPAWLIDGVTLPVLTKMIARADVESKVTIALESHGAAILTGGSGLGKSTVARAVAYAKGNQFYIVDFRNMQSNETRIQLDMVLAHIGGLPLSTLILEDLNHFDDQQVSMSLARVIEALRWRNCVAIITCYSQPSLRAANTSGLNQDCFIGCPYFSEEETAALVERYGGNPKGWRRLTYMAGAFGHPQLTHAFVDGTARRGWPIEEFESTIDQGMSSEDTDSARDAARKNLLTALPEGCRILLYRLSLLFGRFHRSLALTIGKIEPSVPNAGEHLDFLVGPWIENVGKGYFKISPLISDSGRQMLSFEEKLCIHKTIAAGMLNVHTIDASDVDTILTHALAGKSEQSLTAVARMVLSADLNTAKVLSQQVLFFQFIRTDTPIFPSQITVSALLRLAQFKLLTTTSSGDNLSQITSALFDEISYMPEGEQKRGIESTALILVLNTAGIANHLDDWVSRLLRLQHLVEADEFLQDLVASFECNSDDSSITFFSGMFSIGTANLNELDRLEHIIDELDEVDAPLRKLFLAPVDKSQSDFSTFINGPWASYRFSEEFDPADVAVRYGRIAEETQKWDIYNLYAQCIVAQATMLDEYLNDRHGALGVLEKAVASIGHNPILKRAIAKVHWRHEEYYKALEIFRKIGNRVGAESPVERAFALREAAISAAKCDDWPQAEEWFRNARDAAQSIPNENMKIMMIGLTADSAVAALEAGNPVQAIQELGTALTALKGIDPEVTTRAAYCHRVVRHAVLWTRSRLERVDIQIGGESIMMEAGTCSNPDPLPAVRELPLTHIDAAWYMLAEVEHAAGMDAGILVTLENRLEQGTIPILEATLQHKAIRANIDRLNAVGFCDHYIPFLETAAYIQKQGKHLKKTFNPEAPERGQVPTLDLLQPLEPEHHQAAKDAILSYGIQALLENQPKAISDLEIALGNRFTDPFPGKSVFYELDKSPNDLSGSVWTAEDCVRALLGNDYLHPKVFWMAVLRFFEWTGQSLFKDILMPKLAMWQRSGWERILANQRFMLFNPRQNVPSIEDALKISSDDRSSIARLILAASTAVESRLSPEYQKTLVEIADI